MPVRDLESILLFVSDLSASRKFYAGFLELAVLFEDDIVVVVSSGSGRIVLHRNDRGHDERGIFPVGNGTAGVAIRFGVDDPDAWEKNALRVGTPVLWQSQEALWGRFVVLSDPDGRPVVLAKMKRFD